MHVRKVRKGLARLVATVAIMGALTGSVTNSAHAKAATEPHGERLVASAAREARTSSWTPVAAYSTYWECIDAASNFPGYAICTYEGGSYPWVLWIWTW